MWISRAPAVRAASTASRVPSTLTATYCSHEARRCTIAAECTMARTPRAAACHAAGSVTSPVTASAPSRSTRSEEHTSELQSPCNLVCRLLLEKKKKKKEETNKLKNMYRRVRTT